MNWKNIIADLVHRPCRQSLGLAIDRADDLPMLSAYVQGAICPVGKMRFSSQSRQFSLEIDRPCYDHHGGSADQIDQIWRRPSRIEIDHVYKVQSRQIDQKCRENCLVLHNIKLNHKDAGILSGAGELALTLLFADDAAIRLEIAAISCSLTDIGDVRAEPNNWAEPIELQERGNCGRRNV